MQDASTPQTPEDFLDFELEIGVGSDLLYPLTVVSSPAGEAQANMHFPFDKVALDNQLLTLQNALLRSGAGGRQVLLPEKQKVQDFGHALFTTLFSGEVGNLYAASQAHADERSKNLRLKLRILSPEMAVVPWEFLYDPNRGEYLCLSRHTPVVRYIDLPQPPQALLVTPPLRILGMIAAPVNLPTLDVKAEQQRIEEAIKPLQQRGLVQLTWLSGQTWEDVQQAMLAGRRDYGEASRELLLAGVSTLPGSDTYFHQTWSRCRNNTLLHYCK